MVDLHASISYMVTAIHGYQHHGGHLGGRRHTANTNEKTKQPKETKACSAQPSKTIRTSLVVSLFWVFSMRLVIKSKTIIPNICSLGSKSHKLTWLVLGGDPVARSHRVEQFTAL